MRLVLGMTVRVVHEVAMPGVMDSLVTARVAVLVPVLGVSGVSAQRMLVPMAIVLGMRVTVMQIVEVAGVVDGRMLAGGTMRVGVAVVDGVLRGGTHRS
jgi:hypothetical protein